MALGPYPRLSITGADQAGRVVAALENATAELADTYRFLRDNPQLTTAEDDAATAAANLASLTLRIDAQLKLLYVWEKRLADLPAIERWGA